MKASLALLGAVGLAWRALADSGLHCPGVLDRVYADMHDGDKKEVAISRGLLKIKPSGNNQSWVVATALDAERCGATVDFNVPGKPGPPPVNLSATLWYAVAAKPGGAAALKTSFEFTDPSGTLAAPGFPLNSWIQLTGAEPYPAALPCPRQLHAVYADMHDGDKKEVSVDGDRMTIRPSGNNQTWEVHAVLDPKLCSAVVDFNVPGKPSPPPMNLTLTLWNLWSGTRRKTSFEFTDPSGSPADLPLNSWLELPSKVLATLI